MLRHGKRLALALLTSAAFAACSSSSSPAPSVPVAGPPSDLAALAGHWEGEYMSEATGRSGTIVFDLKPGDQVARGDVLMVPKGASASPPSSKLPGTSDTLGSMPQVLSIQFVSASGGVVSGTMDPYRDPECDCDVQTTFVGRLSGNTVEGTFTTTPGGNAALMAGRSAITTGRWKIARKGQ